MQPFWYKMNKENTILCRFIDKIKVDNGNWEKYIILEVLHSTHQHKPSKNAHSAIYRDLKLHSQTKVNF